MPTDKELEALYNPMKVFNEHLPEIVADSVKAKEEFFGNDREEVAGEDDKEMSPFEKGFKRGFELGGIAGHKDARLELRDAYDKLLASAYDMSARRVDEALVDMLEDYISDEEEDSSDDDVGGEG